MVHVNLVVTSQHPGTGGQPKVESMYNNKLQQQSGLVIKKK